MHFDDRLATVLDQPAATPHDRAVQWRQLVDLVARAASGDDPLVARALARIEEGRAEIAEPLRSSAVRAIAGLPLIPKLVALFAGDRATIAAPVLVASQLSNEGWAQVWAAASDESKVLLQAARPEIAAGFATKPKPKPAALPAPSDPAPTSIGDIVARVDRPRDRSAPDSERALRGRQGAASPPGARARVADPAPALFRWECGPSGEIEWVDGVPRGALVGRSIATDHEDRPDPLLARALASRAPFREGVLELAGEGPVAGAWRISGMPDFDPADGRFNGYRGVAWRGGAMPTDAPPQAGADRELRDGDSLRELVHEIRTPLNAIIGFAEIIDGQYLGPAHRSYRERAAEIVRQARYLLDAVQDLDLAAKLQSSRDGGGEGALLVELVPPLRSELERLADERRIGFAVRMNALEGRVALEFELAHRLMLRFGQAVVAATDSGEAIELAFDRVERRLTIGLTRPRSTRSLAEAALLDPGFHPGAARAEDERPLGLGFALRLLRGLATIVGGSLAVERERLVLSLPLTDAR